MLFFIAYFFCGKITHAKDNNIYVTVVNNSDRPIVSCTCVYTCEVIAKQLDGNILLHKNLYEYDDDNYDGFPKIKDEAGLEPGSMAQALGYLYNGSKFIDNAYPNQWYPEVTPLFNRPKFDESQSRGLGEQTLPLKVVGGIRNKNGPYLYKYKYFNMGFSMKAAGEARWNGVNSAPATTYTRYTVGDYLGNNAMLRTYAPWGIFFVKPQEKITIKLNKSFCDKAGYTPNNLMKRPENKYYYSFFPFFDIKAKGELAQKPDFSEEQYTDMNELVSIGSDGGWRNKNLSFSRAEDHYLFIHNGSSLSNTALVDFTKPILEKTSDTNFPEALKNKYINDVVVNVDLTNLPNTDISYSLYAQDPGEGFCSWQVLRNEAGQSCSKTPGWPNGGFRDCEVDSLAQSKYVLSKGYTHTFAMGYIVGGKRERIQKYWPNVIRKLLPRANGFNFWYIDSTSSSGTHGRFRGLKTACGDKNGKHVEKWVKALFGDNANGWFDIKDEDGCQHTGVNMGKENDVTRIAWCAGSYKHGDNKSNPTLLSLASKYKAHEAMNYDDIYGKHYRNYSRCLPASDQLDDAKAYVKYVNQSPKADDKTFIWFGLDQKGRLYCTNCDPFISDYAHDRNLLAFIVSRTGWSPERETDDIVDVQEFIPPFSEKKGVFVIDKYGNKQFVCGGKDTIGGEIVYRTSLSDVLRCAANSDECIWGSKFNERSISYRMTKDRKSFFIGGQCVKDATGEKLKIDYCKKLGE